MASQPGSGWPEEEIRRVNHTFEALEGFMRSARRCQVCTSSEHGAVVPQFSLRLGYGGCNRCQKYQIILPGQCGTLSSFPASSRDAPTQRSPQPAITSEISRSRNPRRSRKMSRSPSCPPNGHKISNGREIWECKKTGTLDKPVKKKDVCVNVYGANVILVED